MRILYHKSQTTHFCIHTVVIWAHHFFKNIFSQMRRSLVRNWLAIENVISFIIVVLFVLITIWYPLLNRFSEKQGGEKLITKKTSLSTTTTTTLSPSIVIVQEEEEEAQHHN